MNVQTHSLPRWSLKRITRLSLVLAVLFIGVSVVFGEMTYPLQPGGGISPNWTGPQLPEIPELLAPGTLPDLPTLPSTPTGHETPTPPPTTQPDTPSYAPCNPFTGLYGQNVLVHLEGEQVISGYLMDVCQGYVVLEQVHIPRTFVVNAAKVLYFEVTDVQ